MQNLLIAYATPVFFLLMALEYWYSRRLQREVYEFSDSLTSIGCGMVTVTVELFAKAGLLWLFAQISASSPWQRSAQSLLTWLLFFLLLDFVYYWAHRWSHEINLLWAGHVPHHQSEEYNLSTALRQGAFQDILHWPLYLLLAVTGCPAEVFIVLLTFSKFYQFWIHTRLIERMPLIEGILNTPSAHRVHHGINDGYIDKNHGGTLMIWDRLFGTYVPETEAVVFGVRKPCKVRDPLWAQMDWFACMWRDAHLSGGFGTLLKIAVMPTGWRPAQAQARAPRPRFSMQAFAKWRPTYDRGVRQRATICFLLAMAFNSTMLMTYGLSAWGVQILLASGCLLSLWLMSYGLASQAQAASR